MRHSTNKTADKDTQEDLKHGSCKDNLEERGKEGVKMQDSGKQLQVQRGVTKTREDKADRYAVGKGQYLQQNVRE